MGKGWRKADGTGREGGDGREGGAVKGEEVRQVERKEGEAGGWLVLDGGGVGR